MSNINPIQFNAKRQRRDERRKTALQNMPYKKKASIINQAFLEDAEYYAYTALRKNTPWYWRVVAAVYRLARRFHHLSLRKAVQRVVSKVKGL